MSTETPSETPAAPPLDLSRIAQDLQLRKVQVEAVVQLLDEGFVPSYMARFRKDRVGMDESRIRTIQHRVRDLRALRDRKATLLKTIEAQGRLNDSIKQAITSAETNKRLDDLYLPFKPKKKSIAVEAREKGLDELARAIWTNDSAVSQLSEVLNGMVNPERGLNSVDDILTGVKLILAEMWSDMADVRAPVRFALWESGKVTARKADPKPEAKSDAAPATAAPAATEPTAPAATEIPAPTADTSPGSATPSAETASAPAEAAADTSKESAKAARAAKRDAKAEQKAEEYRDYFEFNEGLRAIPPHRILAINRGEREHVLAVKLTWNEKQVAAAARSHWTGADHPHREILDQALDLALNLLVLPSLEKEIRRELTEESLNHAVEIFSRNFRSLILTPPVRNRRVLAVDPGTRAGCKVVALDERGTPLENVTLHPLPPQAQTAEAKSAIAELIRKHQLHVIAIGNGSNCREIESLVSDVIAELENPTDGRPAVPDLSYVITNEAGAADYADSPSAREEFPNEEKGTRGTISIGRRLQDPLAELVKIDPQHVGVGLYQHDVKPKQLKESIDEVIESCVNEVGVDVNAAGPALLRFSAGLNAVAAQEIIQYRTAHGPFASRKDLAAVPNIPEAKLHQALPFLKIKDGAEPLDATWIHPEHYAVARQLLAESGFVPDDLRNPERIAKIKEALAGVDLADAARRFEVAESLMHDLAVWLGDPLHDPRDSRTPPVLKRRMLRLEDLTPGMELKGTVVNVVPFGSFVDIGLKDTGLVHISRMANKYIKNPYEVVGVGDVVPVWVVEIDNERKRASLTMIPPGQERKLTPRPAFAGPRGDRPERGERSDRGERQDRAPRPPRGPREPGQDRGGDRGPRPGGGDPRRGAGSFGGERRDTADRSDRGGGGPPPARRGDDRRFRGPRPNQRSDRPVGQAGGNEGAAAPAPEPPRKPAKPKKLPKLSADALTGKAPLFSFGELEAFFKQKDADPAAEAAPPETKSEAAPAETPPPSNPPADAPPA